MLNDSAAPRVNVAALLKRWALAINVPVVLTSVGLAYCFALRLLWISDVPFILDEPQLFAKAMQANAEGGWAQRGLQGSQGVHYGAMPTWIYQLMLRAFSSPIEVAFAKAFLITLLTLGCLWVWAKRLRGAERGLLAIAFLSPCLWFYARDLWDNSWGIPFSMVLWTSYLYFDDKPSLRRLIVPAVTAAALVLIHLMSLPLIGAVGIHFVVKHRAWIMRRWAGVAALALLLVAIDFQYLSQLFQLEREVRPGGWSLRGLGFFLKAPTYFSGIDLTYLMGRAWMDIPAFPKAVQILLRLAVGLSLLSYLFFAAGVVQAVGRGSWLVMKRRELLPRWCRPGCR